MPIFDQSYVNGFLQKPIELEKEIKLARGDALDGSEQALSYTDEECAYIEAEKTRLYEVLKQGQPRNQLQKGQIKNFVLTAGGPGSGKTTLINNVYDQTLRARKDMQMSGVSIYIDPDETILKNMVRYQQDLGDQSPENQVAAYTKWRWASNYISHSLMNRACDDGFDIFYGTTGTSPAMLDLYDKIHAQGYEITVLVVAAPDAVRVESSHKRHAEKRDRFTPEKDVVEKGKMAYASIANHFLKADSLAVHWRDQVDASPVLAAVLVRGRCAVHDRAAIDALNADFARVAKGPLWDDLVRIAREAHSKGPAGPAVPQPT